MGGSQSTEKDKDGTHSVHTVADKIDSSSGSQFTIIRFHGSSVAIITGLMAAVIVCYLVYRFVQWRKARRCAEKGAEAPAVRADRIWRVDPRQGQFGLGPEGQAQEGGMRRANRDYDNEGFCLECGSRPGAGPPPCGGAGASYGGLRAPGEGAPDVMAGHYNN